MNRKWCAAYCGIITALMQHRMQPCTIQRTTALDCVVKSKDSMQAPWGASVPAFTQQIRTFVTSASGHLFFRFWLQMSNLFALNTSNFPDPDIFDVRLSNQNVRIWVFKKNGHLKSPWKSPNYHILLPDIWKSVPEHEDLPLRIITLSVFFKTMLSYFSQNRYYSVLFLTESK